MYHIAECHAAHGARYTDTSYSEGLHCRFGRGGFSFRPLVLFVFLASCLAFPGLSFADTVTTDRGRASWYGTTAHGKLTANGEIFSRYNLTAAHKTLPFGTVIRVYNLTNGRHVLVRVNDRGPYVPGRMLDISRRAAAALKMLHIGIAPIAYEVVSDRRGVPLNKSNAFFVHIRNERDAQKARDLSDRLSARLQSPVKLLPSFQSTTSSYALCLGPFDTFGKAQKEFLRCEEESLALRGIVEAPADGDRIPRYAAPQKNTRGTARMNASGQKETRGADRTTPYGAALHALWGRSLEKGAHLLDIALGAVSGIQGNQPIFRLHYSLLSDNLDLSS